jgi:hypothetical protein
MKRPATILVAAIAPVPALAHEAFGDLGPFYASLLHPLADTLQGAVVVGAAAVLAARPLERARTGLPLFLAAAAAAQFVLAALPDVAPPPLAIAASAMAAGIAAVIPARWTRGGALVPLLAVTGFLAGLAPGAAAGLPEATGTLLGIAILATLGWAVLETLAHRVSFLAPRVAGAWVAAVGLLAVAFALGPMQDTASGQAMRATPPSDSAAP